MTTMTTQPLNTALSISGNDGARIGEDRIKLLEEIEKSGSISAAAKAVGVSYKTAWDAVNTLNNLFPKPLIAAKSGGKSGGGTELTEEGKHVIEAFSLVSQELNLFFQKFSEKLQTASPATEFSTHLWSMIMRTSARNTFHGTISYIQKGAVNAEVRLTIADGIDITAIVTNQSIETLGLEIGKDAFAMIKSSFVILSRTNGQLKTSARNRLSGKVIQCNTGSVNDEIILDLGHGRTLAAIVTHESATDLDFREGDELTAHIKASHIILAVT